MIGITLVEDIAMVLMTVVIPLLGGSGEGRWKPAAWAMGKAILLLIPLAFLAMKVVPPIL
jgi:K+:H+ antiporter